MTTAAGDQRRGFPGSIEIEGVTLYEGEDSAWRYIPGKPIPEMSGGRPTLHLYVSASGGLLQLGAQWTVKPDLLVKLAQEIARRTGQKESEIQMQPAPTSVKQVTVETGDGTGPRFAIGTSSSSGFPPYNAIFRIPVDSANKDAVVAALNGNAGFLAVRYRAASAVKVSARAVIEGDVSRASEALSSFSTLQEIVDWINAAVGDGRLTFSVKGIGEEADVSLLAKVREMALQRFAQALQEWLRRQEPIAAGESVLRVEAMESTLVDKGLERQGDVSEWFEPGQGNKHITILPGGHPGPSPTETKVSLGFPAVELPVAFVEARVAGKKALLRPPGFEAVVLAATGTPLQVTTHYATGQPPYKSQVELSESERLDPATLGLTKIVVDGTGRRDAGVNDILLRLAFQPSGPGAPEDRTFHLHEQQWVASFFLATRGEPIAGEFDLDWTETTGQQQTRRHAKVKDRTVFVLHEMQPPQGADETNL